MLILILHSCLKINYFGNIGPLYIQFRFLHNYAEIFAQYATRFWFKIILGQHKKLKRLATRAPPKIRDEHICSRRVSSSNLVKVIDKCHSFIGRTYYHRNNCVHAFFIKTKLYTDRHNHHIQQMYMLDSTNGYRNNRMKLPILNQNLVAYWAKISA
jgi:hypothetical protein